MQEDQEFRTSLSYINETSCQKKFVVTVDDIVSFFFITEHYLMHLDIYIFIDVVHRHSKIADTQYLGFFHYLCFLWCEMPSHF